MRAERTGVWGRGRRAYLRRKKGPFYLMDPPPLV